MDIGPVSCFVRNERTPAGNLKATWEPAWRKWALSCDLGDPMSNKAFEMEVEMAEHMERSAKDPTTARTSGDGASS